VEQTTYALKTGTDLPFQEAINKVTAALKTEGFGVLTEIDVKETLKKKLNVDFRNYKILGACNPPAAFRALQNEIDIGLMLPCNVVVYETGEGRTVVAAIDPVASMKAVENAALEEHAREIRGRLKRVMEAIEESS
jgi:uncharacterized protein (DUF302 family)